jgi:hypothetical protein
MDLGMVNREAMQRADFKSHTNRQVEGSLAHFLGGQALTRRAGAPSCHFVLEHKECLALGHQKCRQGMPKTQRERRTAQHRSARPFEYFSTNLEARCFSLDSN